MAKDKYVGTRDLALVEFLSQRGICWEKWRLEHVGHERFWYVNTVVVRGEIAQYQRSRNGIVTLGELAASKAAVRIGV